MSNIWEKQRNKREKTKRDRAQYKQSSRVGSSEPTKNSSLETPPEQVEAGIISSIHKNKLEIMMDHHTVEAKFAPAVFAGEEMDFAVGDRVWVTKDAEERALVIGRQERKSFLGRSRSDSTRYAASEWHVLAANVDIGVITVSLKNPDVQSEFIDRYLILLQDGAITPIICLTKADLSTERPAILDFYTSIGVPIIETSSVSGRGMAELKAMLSKKTAVFVGQSGVGKSSLVKAIDPSLDIATQAVSIGTGEGKHTTTRSNLYEWEEDSFIIDTPGIRSLGVEVIPKKQIRFLFPEFSELALKCKYHDCVHIAEPDCAVKQALQGVHPAINQQRYDSYRRMMGDAYEGL